MRRIDKKLNMMKANLLAESRYLESKGLIKEEEYLRGDLHTLIGTEMRAEKIADNSNGAEHHVAAYEAAAKATKEFLRQHPEMRDAAEEIEAHFSKKLYGLDENRLSSLFGGFKKESVYPYIGQLKELLLPSRPLTIEMAEKAPNSINKFNQIVDAIKADKGIVKKMGKKGISLKTTLGTDQYGINRASNNYNSDMNDLYLGNVGGLNTKALSFWIKNIDDAEVANTIGKQLSGWVNDNINHVIEVLTSLTKD
jgi:hypothetical protein